jgi:YbbR domain-containing protein
MFRFDFPDRGRLARDLRKWVRGLFLKDWTLKLLALGIALVLWYGVTGQRAPVTERIPGVQLTFRLPDKLVISNSPRNDVELSVTGARQLLDRLRGRDLEVVVSLSDYAPGDHTLRLNSDSVKVTALPDGVTLNRVEPNTIKVRLETSIEHEFPVEVPTTGSLAEGCELYGIRLQPATVRVTGPASRINELTKVESDTVKFNGKCESFTVERLGLRLPDDQVDLVDALVKATFDIGELEGVAVRAPENSKPIPDKAAVTIFGPRSLVEKVHATDLEIALAAKDGAAPTPSLNVLRQDWANLLTLRATRPAVFSLGK